MADTDDTTTPVDPVEPGKISLPQRGIRRRVLGHGDGDHCIYVISDGSGIPAGVLVPLPGVPRFTSAHAAKRWIRNESGDLLANKQIIIFKALDVINVVASTKRVLELQEKMKVAFNSNGDGKPSSTES